MKEEIKDDLWSIRTEAIDKNNYFGVMVANGMIGAVSDAIPLRINEVILNGVYDRYKRGRVSNILKAFNPFNIDLFLNERHINLENIQNYTQELNMKEASFKSSFETEDAIIKHEITSLRHLPYTCLVTLKIQAKKVLDFVIQNQIESPDHLREVKNYYSEIDRPHVKIPLLSTEADSPSGKFKLAVSNSFIFDEAHGDEPNLIHEDWDFNRHLIKLKKSIEAGQIYSFSFVSSICTSVNFSDPLNEAERLSIYAKLEGIDSLKKRHLNEWDKLWKGDIEIEGSAAVQREIRLMLYYLYASARAGSRLSLSPVGLSGLGYNGHVFWDTELWMFPPLLILQPELAKSLLDYRFDRLHSAKQNAFTHGFKGAMFPWESADDGTEQTPVWALTGPFQQHITACVGWTFWKYYQVTKDKKWLAKKGFPVLKEVADFWCSRVERNGSGKYDINNVIGANEFEENIDNNAFTNGIVKTVLKYATQAAHILDIYPNKDWDHVAENIPILQFDDGTTKENKTYNGAEIKQADVNLLSHPIELFTDPAQIKKDLDYYEPRMSADGPAMGFATLATLHAQLGNVEKAYEVFIKSYRSNAVPPFGVLAECAGGKGVSPYFTTGAGGVLQTVIFGFGGIKITDKGIVKGKQNLPKNIISLKIKV